MSLTFEKVIFGKFFPQAYASSYYRMRDQNGEMGLFMGSVESGRANGDGSMEYDDGKRFVGQFYKMTQKPYIEQDSHYHWLITIKFEINLKSWSTW